jgi:tetratricopeptide (TPR) repeat protein
MRRWLSSTWMECLYDLLTILWKTIGRASAWVFQSSKELIAFLSLIVGLAILAYLYFLAQLGVVEDFTVPEELSKRGFTGAVAAHRLVDGFREIRDGAGGEGQEPYSTNAGPRDSLKLLEAEVPVTFIVEMIRTMLDLPTRKIDGEIIELRPTQPGGPMSYSILLRIQSEFCTPQACIVRGSSGSVEDGLNQLSADTLRKVDPYVIAVYYLRRNDIPAALALIPDFIRQKNIPEADRYNVKGGILRKAGDRIRAREAYELAISSDPRNPSPHFNLAELFRDAGNLDQAIPEYQQAILRQNALSHTDPKMVDFYCGLANGYRDQAKALSEAGKIKESSNKSALAEENYGKAMALNPTYARTFAGWGTLLLNEGRMTDAKGKYEEAIRLDPALAQAYLGLAEVFRSSGQLAQAAEMYKKAIKASEENRHSDEKSERAARSRLQTLEKAAR